MSNNKMLIDATHPEETRVVVLRGGRVEEFDYESAARKLLRGNIYLAKVTRVEPSLQAAFVDYGGNRHGFLAFNEIHPDYYQIPMADRQALLDEEAAAEAEEEAAADARAEAMARRRALRDQARGQRRREGGDGDDGGDEGPSGDGGDDYDAGSDEQPYDVRPHQDDGDEGEGHREEDEGEERSRGRRGRRGRGRRGRDRGDRGEQRTRSGRPEGRSSEPHPEAGDDEQRFAAPHEDMHGDDREDGDEDRRPGVRSSETSRDEGAEHAHHGHDHHDHDHHHDDHHHQHAGHDHVGHGEHDHEHPAPGQTEAGRGHAPHAANDDDGREASSTTEGGDAPQRTLSEARGLADERLSGPAPAANDDMGGVSDREAAPPADDAVPVPRGNVEDEGVSEVNGNGENGEADQVDQVGSEDALEELPSRPRRRPRSYKIQEVIKRRQIILVQVVKEERGNKGAALTTYLSLAGRYTVLMPNTARGGGISRKITQPQDRKRLKAIAASLEVPEGMGLIIRTAGAARTAQEIKRDFEYLLRLWESVRDLTLQSVAPSLVYEEGNLIKRSIRDLYNKDIDEIVVAGGPAHAEAYDFMRMLMPSHAKNVTNYREPEPLFTRFQIERQLNAMFSPYVTLRSGGYLVINQTEALVAIDVNSGRSTREFSIEETALNTNLEAAEEIARQLKLRDLAGLIVIDFIDMEERRNNRRVENRLKDALRFDRARIQVGRISHFGLLEMSRQRLRTGVLEGSTAQCAHCQGTGIIRSTESVALAVLRGLEDSIMGGARTSLIATTTATVALYILNNKRPFIIEMERRTGLPIVVQGSDKMQGANFTIEKGAAPVQAARRPERTAVNMDWGFEGEADDGDVDSEIGMADASIDVDGDEEPRGRDEGQRHSGNGAGNGAGNGEEGGRRRRRRRRRGRRGERGEGGQPMHGSGDDMAGDEFAGDEMSGEEARDVPAGEGYRDDRAAYADEGEDRAASDDRDDVREHGADADEPGMEASDEAEGGDASGDGEGQDGSRRRGRRRGRRGGRRGRDRAAGADALNADQAGGEQPETHGDAHGDERAVVVEGAIVEGEQVTHRPVAEPADAHPVAAEAAPDSAREAQPKSEPVPPRTVSSASSDAAKSPQPGPAAAAAEAVIAVEEVSEQAAAQPPAQPAVAEEPAPALRRRSTASSEPRIERVVVRPDATSPETQEVSPSPAAEPRRGWWSRKLLG